MSSATAPKTPFGDPFLLPVCSCGGPMNLASLEPHPAKLNHELKTFKCRICGTEQVFDVPKRRAAG